MGLIKYVFGGFCLTVLGVLLLVLFVPDGVINGTNLSNVSSGISTGRGIVEVVVCGECQNLTCPVVIDCPVCQKVVCSPCQPIVCPAVVCEDTRSLQLRVVGLTRERDFLLLQNDSGYLANLTRRINEQQTQIDSFDDRAKQINDQYKNCTEYQPI